ncbi:hypothetical protein DFH28DRAFT_482337 [Melampsora americana]|nr:hypothetical protein DFH28DRAFT_482337 [Melampsora americana]
MKFIGILFALVVLSFVSGNPTSGEHKLEKRERILCNPGGDKATYRDVKNVINKLKGRGNDQCTAAPGPRVCTRVGCSHGSYVTFCNDTNKPITRYCSELGDMAQRVVDSCSVRGSQAVFGQNFHSNIKFNVIVKGGGKC